MFGLSKTAFLWSGFYLAALIFAFVHPVYGLYGYFLDYYAHPPMRWWGKGLPDFRWSLIIALVTMAAYLLRRRSLPELKVKSHPQSKWLILLILTAFFVTISPLSVWAEKSWEQLLELTKLGILYFLIVHIVRTKEHFNMLFLVQIIGVAYWGWNAFTDPHRASGRLFGIGGPDSFNDNAAAAHLLAILPMIAAVYLTGRWWEKAICLVAAPLALNTFILCNSRGSVIALMVVGVMTIFITSGTLRKKAIFAMIGGGILLYGLADPNFIERQKTIQTYEKEASAIGRMETWKGALNLIQDYPLGTGGGGFNALSPVYIPRIVALHDGRLRTVHNTYLLAASDWGIPGLVFFLLFFSGVFLNLYRIRRDLGSSPEDQRIFIQSVALMLGLVGVLIAGVFTNRLYAEAPYWLAAFGAALMNIKVANKEMQVSMEDKDPSPNKIKSYRVAS